MMNYEALFSKEGKELREEYDKKKKAALRVSRWSTPVGAFIFCGGLVTSCATRPEQDAPLAKQPTGVSDVAKYVSYGGVGLMYLGVGYSAIRIGVSKRKYLKDIEALCWDPSR